MQLNRVAGFALGALFCTVVLGLWGVPANTQAQTQQPGVEAAPAPTPSPGPTPETESEAAPTPVAETEVEASPGPDAPAGAAAEADQETATTGAAAAEVSSAPETVAEPAVEPAVDAANTAATGIGAEAAAALPAAEPEAATATELQQDAGTEEGAPSFKAIAIAPAPGAVAAMSKVPRGVLTVDAELLQTQHPLGLADALELRLAGVTLNDVQSNPLQRDLQYRGFTASPLLGTPQGLAVFQNGVRVNESFGDVVQWDTLPEIAVAEAQVIPGANPLYGLNALGGSLALRMKNGYRFQGHRLTGYTGSFGRYVASGEFGRRFDGWAFYGAISQFGEEGFRDASRSSATRAFADARHIDADSELGINVTVADTDLNGNGPSPVELLATEGRSAVFTYPDNTQNQLVMAAADLDRDLAEHVSMQATAYVRHLERHTLNGDEGEFSLCDDEGMTSLLCDEEGERVISEAGSPIETETAFNALFNTSETVTNAYGGSMQVTLDQALAGTENQLLVGTTYDGGHVAFLQRAEVGYLTSDRTVLGQGRYLADDSFRTDLEANNRYLGFYLADTWTPVQGLSLLASARFSWANVELLDQGDSGALDGSHYFTRLLPSAGITYTPLPELTLFASYAESNRVPSAAELACADPDEPCRVPNAFVADPPLEQVVSRSGEVGVRGHVGEATQPLFRYSVAGFWTRNFDDILFVAGSRVGTGYFRNAGKTQRMGLEIDASGDAGPVRFFAGYTLLRATFESNLSLPGNAHPALGDDDDADDADDGDDDDDGPGAELAVSPGDRIPGLPVHSFKAGFSVRPVPRWEIGVTVLARGGVPFRGDEANLLDDLSGYATVGAYSSYQLLDQLEIFVKGQNLLDTEYDTFGVLAEPDEVLPGTSDPRFVGPGAPLAVFAGLVVHDG